eukprot:TRINITY_DN10843_c0_g1_i7.p1 TRINITY_DN10843_c0_g1~~TRINITY_DN10843_c0_g1_i7.p1  ORF type:complete len:410 (+),score=114.92 TRINITY_DN10843_c0_g1_i7:112-1341(+)
MIRRPPRSTLSSSSAASDVYKRQVRWSEGSALEWGDDEEHRAEAVLQFFKGEAFSLKITHTKATADRTTHCVESVLLVGDVFSRSDGGFDLHASSKANLNLEGTPVSAVLHAMTLHAVPDTVVAMGDGSKRVTSLRITGDVSSVSTVASRGLGEDLLAVKIQVRAAAPIDLATLVDADNDGVPDELKGWAQKLFGDRPRDGRHTLYLCHASGEVFDTKEEYEKYSVRSGHLGFSQIDFWVHEVADRIGKSSWNVSVVPCNPGWEGLYSAIRSLDAEKLDLQLTNRELLQVTDLHGNTILHHIVRATEKLGNQEGGAECMRLALLQGVNGFSVNKDGQSGLHTAAAAGLDSLVELLLIKDGSRKAKMCDKCGKLPIDYARENGHQDSVELLFNPSRTSRPHAGLSIKDNF